LGERPEARPVAVGPGLAERRDADHQELRIPRVQRLRREVEPLEDTRAEALDEHVRRFDEPQQHLAAFLALEIERHGALVPADQEPPRRPAADELAHRAGRVAVAGALDLDHLRAEVREVLPDARAGDDVRELDHTDVGEWKGARHGEPGVYYPRSGATSAPGVSRWGWLPARSGSGDPSGRG